MINTTETIQHWLVDNIANVLELETTEIDVNQDLETYNIDSTKAIILVSTLEKKLGLNLSPVLLWHYPNIKSLAQYLAHDLESSLENPKNLNNHSLINLDHEIELDPTIIPSQPPEFCNTEPKQIFLTGGTGFLGAFLIWELLQTTKADIYCLVRADNTPEGKKKLQNNLIKYKTWSSEFNSRLIPVIGDLSQPLLGINPQQFYLLANDIDIIYHSGAMLNYVYPYSALKPTNVFGTQEILRLACAVRVKPVHYISSIAVWESKAYANQVVEEDNQLNHWQTIYLGYSQSKWVAEKIVQLARHRGLPVTIHRPPLIGGHSQTGVSNPNDFINLMLKGCLQMGIFPDLDYMLDISPVDYVSKAIVYLSKQPQSIGKAFHLQHPHPISFKDLFNWLQQFSHSLKIVPYKKWQSELAHNVTDTSHPLYTLRPFLLEQWSEQQLTIPELYLQGTRANITCNQTLKALAGSHITCPPIDSKLLTLYTLYLHSLH